MKKHFLKCSGIKDACKKTNSQGSKLPKSQGGGEPSSKSKKDRGDKHGNEEKDDKLHGWESKSGGKTASQEQS